MSKYLLQLYVTGQSQRSLRAASNLRRICEQYLRSDYELTLIDIQERPHLAEEAKIFATPATVRVAPPPPFRVVGDLSDPKKVLSGLGIDEADDDPP